MTKHSFADFELPATSDTLFKLSAERGHPVVLYFYPKDNTPGCTTEGQNFRDLYPQFCKLKCAVFGISRDSLKSHENFKAKISSAETPSKTFLKGSSLLFEDFFRQTVC